jgi:hypothetical protein
MQECAYLRAPALLVELDPRRMLKRTTTVQPPLVVVRRTRTAMPVRLSVRQVRALATSRAPSSPRCGRLLMHERLRARCEWNHNNFLERILSRLPPHLRGSGGHG